MSNELSISTCVICRADISNDTDVATVSPGLNKLIEFSQKYGHSELNEYLLSRPSVVKVRNKYRNSYTNEQKLKQALKRASEANSEEVAKPKLLRSTVVSFDWKVQCFFCKETCVIDSRHPDRSNQRRVATLTIIDSVLRRCEERLRHSQGENGI